MQIPQSLARALVAIALLAGVAAAQPSMVSYQGHLDVNGAPFTGNAQFKFAIMCGTASPWSNDGSSSNGSQPTGSVTLPVAQGLFSVLLGDPALSMVALTGDLIESCSSPDLRVWVDTGTGFEQLTDQPLASSPFALKAAYAEGAIGTFKVGDGSSTTFSVNGNTGQAAVGSIKFPDNTVQTTAAVGSGPDGDWIINGIDMSTGVTGNVGIGTAVPDRKLSIQGGSDIDPSFGGGYVRIGPPTSGNLLIDNNEIQAVNNGAANDLGINVEGGDVGIGTVNPASRLHVLGSIRADGTGGFDVRNPNNTGAISRFDWNADIARIRVGGSGTGALNGFDIEGISDVSWLRILNNGNVGINTTAPSERLEVNGNAVIAGNLTVQGVITGGGGGGGTAYLALGPAAFVEENANQTDFNRGTYIHGRTAGQRLNLHASLVLPHGATITRCEVFCTDNEPTQSNGENIVFILLRKPFPSGAGSIISSVGTQNAPGDVTLDSGALSSVVDNQNNYYSLTVYWDTPSAPRLITDMRVHGARITYTMP